MFEFAMGILVGAILGSALGVVVTALCRASKDSKGDNYDE